MNWRTHGWLIGLWVMACGAQPSASVTSTASPRASALKAGGSGALKADQIPTVVAEHENDLRNCKRCAISMTTEVIKGDIMFQWKIAPSGEVTEVSAVNPPSTGEILAKCVTD